MNLVQRLWNSISRKRTSEVEQEMATHFAMLEEHARNSGMAPREATIQARKRFGSQAKYLENTRDIDSAPWFSDLVQDITFAFRQMRKNVGFTFTAVSVIALGISAVTTVFSLVHAVLLNPLPFKQPDRLVYLWTPNSHFGGNVPREVSPSLPDFYDWQRLSRSFSSMTAMNEHVGNLVQAGEPRRIATAFVSSDFFKTLGVKPQLGRPISKSDQQPGYEHVALVSNALWQAQLGGKRDAIGKTITFDRQKYTVIGVMPPSFGYPKAGDVPYIHGFHRTELWAPLALDAKQKTDRTNFRVSNAAIARLRPGVSLLSAQSDLAVIEKRLNLLYPAHEFSRGWEVFVTPLVDTMLGPVSRMLWLLMASVALVLLIACGNVANLLLARVSSRTEELALRVGLGAGRARLARQMLTESLLLASMGGATGVVVSFGAVRLLSVLNPGNIPRFDQTTVNLPVLTFAAAITLFSGCVFGLIPVTAALRQDLYKTLKAGNNRTGNRPHLLSNAVVGAEVALSFTLLAAAMLLIRSYVKLDAQNTGFDRSTLTAKLELDAKYNSPEQKVAFFTRFLKRIQHLPGVIAAGAVDFIPLEQSLSFSTLEIKGEKPLSSPIDCRSVTPGYFQALGTTLLSGRFFENRDLASPGGAFIVNEAFAKVFFHGRSAIGQQARAGPGRWLPIVGVVSNLKNMTLEETPRPEIFRLYQTPFEATSMGYAIRSEVPAETLIPAMRRILHNLDPALALSDILTMRQRMADVNAKRRFQMILLTAFAVAAVLLALIGLYGVLAYSVAQRTAEIGIRMALGASRANVLHMVVRQGLKVVLLGLAVGIGSTLLLVRFIQSSLYGVTADDPITFTLIPLLVASVASCACLVPALKASRVDPAAAIRNP